MQGDDISFKQMLQNQCSIVCLNFLVIYDFLNPQLPSIDVVFLSCSFRDIWSANAQMCPDVHEVAQSTQII